MKAIFKTGTGLENLHTITSCLSKALENFTEDVLKSGNIELGFIQFIQSVVNTQVEVVKAKIVADQPQLPPIVIEDIEPIADVAV